MAAFIESRNYHRGRRRRLRLIVWHDMEAPEARDTAENVARWFAGPTAPEASTHICVDQDSVVECVKPWDTAWAAPGANADGYQIEQAGYARQNRDEWLDAASRATMRNAAEWIAPIMRANNIPARWLTDAQLADGVTAGMVPHVQVSRVFRQSDHSDPGGNFPYDVCLAEVQRALNGGGPLMALSDDEQRELLDKTRKVFTALNDFARYEYQNGMNADGTFKRCPPNAPGAKPIPLASQLDVQWVVAALGKK